MPDLEDYAWLIGNAASQWLEEVRENSEPLHRQLQRLRKAVGATRAGMIVEQVQLRQRAETKFGELAKNMFFTDLGLQQATDLWTAHYKASRIHEGAEIHDFCCGIGGDFVALAKRGQAIAWDSDARVACLAEANLQAVCTNSSSEIVVGNVEELTIDEGVVWHLDPDRRASGKRTTHLAGHSPGPETIERFRKSAPSGCLKLAPAAEIPFDWGNECEQEWISWNRECRQLVVWFGELTECYGKRRATRVAKTNEVGQAIDAVSFLGDPAVRAEVTQQVGAFVYDVDPAVRAARLTGALACDQELHALGNEAGYLTSDSIESHSLVSPFEVLDILPLRIATLTKSLRSLGIGELEIKKRGIVTDPETLRRKLKLTGEDSRTLLLTRIGEREVAILAKRVTDGLTESTSKR